MYSALFLNIQKIYQNILPGASTLTQTPRTISEHILICSEHRSELKRDARFLKQCRCVKVRSGQVLNTMTAEAPAWGILGNWQVGIVMRSCKIVFCMVSQDLKAHESYERLPWHLLCFFWSSHLTCMQSLKKSAFIPMCSTNGRASTWGASQRTDKQCCR